MTVTGARTTETCVTPLAAARSLTDLIRSDADDGEARRELSSEVVDGLREGGLFGLLLPTELGGLGADAVTFIDITEELSRADASVGWCYMVNASSAALFAGAFDDAAVTEIFLGPTTAITSFTGAILPPLPTATRVDGGWVVTGTYSFGSGSGYATWIGGVCTILENGEDAPRIFAVPAERVEFLGNWDVLGLRSTGSGDYRIADVFVPDAFMGPIGVAPLRGHDTFRLGSVPLAVAGHAAVALGSAWRSLEEVVAIADSGKQRFVFPPIIEQQRFKYDFARVEARYRACRAYLVERFTAAQEIVGSGSSLSELDTMRIRQAATHVVDECSAVVEACYGWGGTAGLREPHPLGRMQRDILAETQHMLVDRNSMADSAPALFGMYRNANAT